MTSEKTTFRKTLMEEISALVGSRELDERYVQMKHIEEKRDVLGELLDYYTHELLEYRPFADEFSSAEVEKIDGFLKSVKDAFESKRTWTDVSTQAAKLLKCLEVKKPSQAEESRPGSGTRTGENGAGEQ